MALIVIVTVLFAATWTAADAAASKIDRTKAGSKNKVLVAWFSHTGTSEEAVGIGRNPDVFAGQ